MTFNWLKKEKKLFVKNIKSIDVKLVEIHDMCINTIKFNSNYNSVSLIKKMSVSLYIGFGLSNSQMYKSDQRS